MIGIIDSAISSRFFQLVNESSLTVTGLSFELGGAHMLAPRFSDLSIGIAWGDAVIGATSHRRSGGVALWAQWMSCGDSG